MVNVGLASLLKSSFLGRAEPAVGVGILPLEALKDGEVQFAPPLSAPAEQSRWQPGQVMPGAGEVTELG